VEVLHRIGILHRDLKTPNILVNGKFGESVCITDFGMALLRKETSTKRQTEAKYLGEHEPVGSYPWMAPEIMLAGKYKKSADIFSLGVILWEIFTSKEPWEDAVTVRSIEHAVLSGVRPSLEGLSAELASLLDRMWHENPQHRPNAAQVTKLLQNYIERNGLGSTVPLPATPTNLPGSSNLGSSEMGIDLSGNLTSATFMSSLSTARVSQDWENVIKEVGTPPKKSGSAVSLPYSRRHVASIVVFGLACLFGLMSFIGVTVAFTQKEDEDDYYYEEDYWTGADITAIVGGIFSTLFSATATPLVYKAAKRYQRDRNSRGRPELVKPSWVLYGLALTFALIMIIVGSVTEAPHPVLMVIYMLLMIVEWILMHLHASKARLELTQ
jgi:serine/threonine protein kinase